MAPVIQTMFSEWSELVRTLRDLERRIEILQIHQDLDLDNHNKSLQLEESNSVVERDPHRYYYRADYDQVDGGCLTRTRTIPDKVSQSVELSHWPINPQILPSHWSRCCFSFQPAGLSPPARNVIRTSRPPASPHRRPSRGGGGPTTR